MKNIRLIGFIIVALFFVFILTHVYAEENTNSASNYLCEYGIKLYKQGNINDAIQQLKMALMVNPNNLSAKEYLKEILSKQQLQDNQVSFQDTKMKIDQLNNQLSHLQEEKHLYQKQLSTLKDMSLTRDSELAKLIQQLQSQEDLYTKELLRKDKELEDSKSNYENRLTAMYDQVRIKESTIEDLKTDRESFLQENIKIKNQQQLFRIDGLMREIEEIFAELGEPVVDQGYLSEGDEGVESQQIARIDGLMREIEELLAINLKY